jgi:LysR family transcriptional regulator, glycine cleavage system transcriptional activator
MSGSKASLNALRAFEATARLRSMTAAAAELCVTHGAVSRHVRALEDTFGLPLLRREHQSLETTPEGARLAEGLTAAFNLIDASVEQLKPGPLTVSCSATIMMHWLIPRIAGFHAAHPHVEVQFNMNYDQVDFLRDKVSIAIRSSTIPPPRDVLIRELMTEWIGPVWAPTYGDARKLRTIEDLRAARLLSTKTRPQGWEDWSAVVGLSPAVKPNAQEAYEHFYLQIQAALCGLGVAVVPAMLVLDEIRSGRLIAPFGFVPGPRKLLLWIAPHLGTRPNTRAMVNWLSSELEKTAAICAAIDAPRLRQIS